MDITNLINYEQFYCGIPTQISNICSIYPATLREIAQVGVKNFYSYLNFFTLNKEDINDYLAQVQAPTNDLSVFQFHLLNSRTDKTYANNFQKALEFFLHERDITILSNNEAIVLGDIAENRLIRNEEFEAICTIVGLQHFVTSSVEQQQNNPSDAKAAQILKKIRESKKIVDKHKPESDLSFVDLVGSLAAKGNNLNAINIWDLTYYAFNDQFKRMQWVEEYNNGFESLLAGAKANKVNLKHWIRPMRTEKK